MTVVSNELFWIYTVALLIVWIIVLTTAFNNDSNISNKASSPNAYDEDELKNTGNCKSLCKQCGCLGFYCGEECICECNNDHSDTECIGLIQINAKKWNIPFEVLIQGPSSNTFVRNALQFEQNNARRSYGYRNKRSTVTVYKPKKDRQETSTKQNLHKIKSSCQKKTLIKDILNLPETVKDRQKRSDEQFFWFNDFNKNLLRPAPLGGYKRKAEESNTTPSVPKSFTVSSIFDNSWFSFNTHNLLTPAPLSKWKNYEKSAGDIYNENGVDSSLKTLKIEQFSSVDDKFSDDHQEIETIYSDELKNSQTDNKDSFLPEEKKADNSEGNLRSKLNTRLFKYDNVPFLPKQKSTEDKSMEIVTRSIYSFSDLSKNDDDNAFLSPKEKKQDDESYESITGNLYSNLFEDDLSKMDEKESAPQVSLPTEVKKDLHEFKNPWFRPTNFLEGIKRVIRL